MVAVSCVGAGCRRRESLAARLLSGRREQGTFREEGTGNMEQGVRWPLFREEGLCGARECERYKNCVVWEERIKR